MIEPWFEPNRWAWLPGTLFGCTCGLFGALVGILAPRGKARRLVLGLGWLLFGIAAVFLVLGLVALKAGQPYGVWYGLILPGVQGTVLLGLLMPLVVVRAYRQAESRRIQAEDID